MEDKDIASVQHNGLITTKVKCGNSRVTANIFNEDTSISEVRFNKKTLIKKFFKHSILLKVVSLTGVKIEVNSRNVLQGSLVTASIYGISSENETPFAFGGAQYPLKVIWQLSSNDILIYSPSLAVSFFYRLIVVGALFTNGE